MFMANLGFSLLEEDLDVVLGAGFVRGEEYRYKLTVHGRAFFKQIGHFHERSSDQL
jgi:predicted transcriptional regulator